MKKFLTCFACASLLITNVYAQNPLQGHISWTAVDENGEKVLWLCNPDGTLGEIHTFEEVFAYLDYESADDALKEQILRARANLVFGDTRWAADGEEIYITDVDGTIIEKAPNFSDIFPGWDLDAVSKARIVLTSSNSSNKAADFAGNIFLPKGDSSTANEFYYFNSGGKPVTIKALTLPSGATTYNSGFTNADTGKDAGWMSNVSAGTGVKYNNAVNGTRYGARASTYDETGIAYVTVTE